MLPRKPAISFDRLGREQEPPRINYFAPLLKTIRNRKE
jgi:hypothetical protein